MIKKINFIRLFEKYQTGEIRKEDDMRKFGGKTIVVVILSLSFAVLVYAQSSPWGGRGHVYLSASRISANTDVVIEFKLTHSRGSGTAAFVCEVTNPYGVIHIARKASTRLIGGEAEASFYYPSEFGGTDIPCTTSRPGNYQVQCYWYIEGYGVNGKTAAANSAFFVQ